VVDDVVPQRHLSFRWWPEGDDGSAASQVSYDLEPDDDGTLLTVTEEPRPHEATVEPQASLRTTGSWTGWDTRLLRCWAAHMSVAAPVAAGGRAVR
jgi:uncharacterized protein YndB with AHSA1/START domain